MPFYNFQCPKCNKIVEKLLSISKRNEKQLCSDCLVKLDRLISPASGFVFKGEGTYEKDYKQKEGR